MSLAVFNGAAILSTGAAAALATVEVRRESDAALATIYSDEAGTLPIAQPGFAADANGRFTFYAAGSVGGYKITVTKAGGGETYDLRHAAIGTGGQADAGTIGRLVMAADTKVAVRDAIVAAHRAIVGGRLNLSLALSVNGTALTIAVKDALGADPAADSPATVAVRAATAGSSLETLLSITAASSLVISSGSTLGARSGVPFRLWIVAFNDAGTWRLGVINCLTTVAGAGAGSDVTAIYPLKGWGIASSTAEGGAGAADSAQVFYTGAAVAAKPYVVLGYATWEAGLTTAGTWNAAPTRVQLFGPGVPLPGAVIQVQRFDTGAMATGTTVIPFDDTIPQSTEGDQYMSLAIAPSSAANALRARSQIFFSNSLAGGYAGLVALFRDAIANAVKAIEFSSYTSTARVNINVEHVCVAESAASTTFKVRAGGNAAATTSFNGQAGGRLFGGVSNSFIELSEVMA